MSKIYTELTDRLNELSQEEVGEWVIDGENGKRLPRTKEEIYSVKFT